jgi:uncharacterized membrane protein YdjX (TVP38/TMEM64 family)
MPEWMSVENVEYLATQYRALGPFVGFLISFLESYLPFLPLVLFITVNVTAYGVFYGFLLSWLGTLLGSYSVFWLVRKFGHAKVIERWTSLPRVKKLINWVNIAGITPMLVLLCFPFTPAIIVNIVAGLSTIKKNYYFMTLVISKFVMVFLLTFILQDITDLFKHPLKMIFMLVLLLILWIGGKLFERSINKRVERDLRSLAKQKNDTVSK